MSVSTTAKKNRPQGRRWFSLSWKILLAVLLLAAVVLGSQWLRTLPEVQSFVNDYPGHIVREEPQGFPAWVQWSHFFNLLLILLIIRSGWHVRTQQRPPAYWTRNNQRLFRTKGKPAKISLNLWLHLSLDALWVANGVIFYILLFATGQWQRIAPASWEHLPNALSAGLQYASLNWPHENAWVSYNSLQIMAYFVTVFVAAPLAILTGIRMSGVWPKDASINRIYPVEVARAIHLPVMLYFVVFIIVHVTLVLTTGALRNLNHMYAGRDDDSWVGFGFFAGSLVLVVILWFAARPIILRPIANLMGKVTKN